MKRLNTLLLLFVSVMILSCSDDKDKEPTIVSSKLELKTIKWNIEEGDQETEFTEDIQDQIVLNQGSNVLAWKYNLANDIKETSCFEFPNSEIVYELARADINVSIPTDFTLLSETPSYLASGRTAKLKDDTTFLDITTSNIIQYEVAANTKLTCAMAINYKKIDRKSVV